MPDTPRQLDLRIFLASPGDVTNERTLTRSVVDHLRYHPQWRGRVTLDLVAWDNPGAVAMLATATPPGAGGSPTAQAFGV